MTEQLRIADAETRAHSVAKLREVCARFDEQIMILDELIAQVETDICNSQINIRRKKKAEKI